MSLSPRLHLVGVPVDSGNVLLEERS
jgi:hypothetical protein